MQECDWTGTAAAVTALALTAGVWLWPADKAPAPRAAIAGHHLPAADQDDLARWRDEARRWDGSIEQVQLSSAGAAEVTAPVIR